MFETNHDRNDQNKRLRGNQEWTIQTQTPAKGKQFLPSNNKNIYNTITSAKTRQ